MPMETGPPRRPNPFPGVNAIMKECLCRALVPAVLIITLTASLSYAGGKPVRSPHPQKQARPKNIFPRGFKQQAVKKLQYKNDDVAVDMYAQRFAQAYPLYAEVYPVGKDVKEFVLVQVMFNKTPVYFTEKSWGYRLLAGIHAATKPGTVPLALTYRIGAETRSVEYMVPIEKTNFQVIRSKMDLGKMSDSSHAAKAENAALIKRCIAKKSKVFATLSPDRIQAALAHPRNEHFVTSPFWAMRVMARYKTEKGKKINLGDAVYPHSGIDLKGKKGTPVFAVASGKVAIAELMFYEGNFVTIDHGNRIFSHYMHMDSLTVKEGQEVKAGQQIGRVGATGLSLGPHLHFSVVINGLYVDPISFLYLPIRD